MSGGFFDYKQRQIRNMWESIQQQLDRQGQPKCAEDIELMKDFYEDFPEEKFYRTYPAEVQAIFKDAVKYLQLAEIYTQRIDWYLSGDDGENTLYERLAEDLNELNNKLVNT